MHRSPSIQPIAVLSLSVVLSASMLTLVSAAERLSSSSPDLISREILFGNPDRAGVRISPDGKHLSYLAPVDGVMNVWVGPADAPDMAKPVTQDKKRGIRSYFWAYTNQHIVYTQDEGGDEDWHAYAVDLKSGKTTDLTPMKGITARIEGVSERLPGELLISINDRDPALHDVYRVDLKTGERKLVQENPGFASFITDDDYRVRFGSKFNPADGSSVISEPDGKDGWKEFMVIPQEDTLTTNPAGFDKSGDVLYMIDSRGRNTGALKTLDLKTGKETLIAEDEKADLGGALIHPTEKTIQAVSFNYLKNEWQVLDKSIQGDFDALKKVDDGELVIGSRTLDDKTWIVAFTKDDGPVKYYRYDRPSKKATFLFTNRKDLEGLPLVKMHPVVIKSRDGLDLVSYLSLPPGSDTDGDARPEKPVPLVLNVHGGPWSRDDWGYDPMHQWLANRGYAVLSVNFRGSTGFGKEFCNAGNMEWGKKMHDDLLDAVEWAVDEKIAPKDKIAIMGGSYGGYATLAGLTLTPDVFACGVDIVGPSNIITLLSTIPPYWKPVKQMFTDRVGDDSTEEGKAALLEVSPLTHVEKIDRPLLIGQGANDPRVKQAESDQIVKAMQSKKIPVTYVLYPDEGHGFARPENRISFFAVTEAFLAEHLGGQFEPVGKDFSGASITVPAGAGDVPGLEKALKAHQAEAPASKE
jgi:dipeptidyl aminopeptidase/acylaminoacyl peptidase